MWTFLIVVAKVLLVFGVGSVDGDVADVEAPELGSGGVVGAFDAAVPLGSPGRQRGEVDGALFALVLEARSAMNGA